ncbi:hypothetical protein P8C59_004477 [Phyllachora maydis]|uniref:Uncharacterized protein n=1 Tax=Phyllachora maydis TaxID=1825666 RepID=A0AAD9I2G4_9PEZI|nr:hypothetical protein P8C59_004477 [Phyllachora maydis]
MDSASDPDTDGIYIKTEPDTARHQNAEALTLVKLESTSDDVSGNTDAPAQQLSDMHAASRLTRGANGLDGKSTVGVEKAQIYTSIDSLRQVLASSSTFSGRCKLLSAFLGYGIAAATGVQDPPEAGMAWAREVFGDVLHGFDFFLDRIYPFATLQDDEKNSHFLRLRLQFRLIMDIIESMDKADLSNSFHTLRLPFLEQLAGELAKRRNSGPRADPEIHSRPRFQHLFAGGLESYIKHKLEKFDKALLEELLSADYKGIMKRLSLAKNGTVLGATTPLSQATSTSVSGNRGTGTAQVSPSSYGSASSRGVKRSFGGGYT